MTLTTDQQLGPYEILSPLGSGGMGEVWRARDIRLNREVAIKVLPAGFAKDADRLKRFEQEARATSALNYPNILTIYDIGEHDGAPFIVAELLEGAELRAQLQDGGLLAGNVIDYDQQIASGLAALKINRVKYYGPPKLRRAMVGRWKTAVGQCDAGDDSPYCESCRLFNTLTARPAH